MATVVLPVLIAVSGPMARTAAVHRGFGLRAAVVGCAITAGLLAAGAVCRRSWTGGPRRVAIVSGALILLVAATVVAAAGGRVVGAWSVVTMGLGLAVGGLLPVAAQPSVEAVRLPVTVLSLLSAFLAADPTTFAAALTVWLLAAAVLAAGLLLDERAVARPAPPVLALGLLGVVVANEPARSVERFGVVYGIDGAWQSVLVAASLAVAAVVPRTRGDLLGRVTGPIVALAAVGMVVSADRQRLLDGAALAVACAGVAVVSARHGRGLRSAAGRGRERLVVVRGWLPDPVWVALTPGVVWMAAVTAIWVRGLVRSGAGGFRALNFGLDPSGFRLVFALASVAAVPWTILVVGSVVSVLGGRHALRLVPAGLSSAVLGAVGVLTVGWVFPGVLR